MKVCCIISGFIHAAAIFGFMITSVLGLGLLIQILLIPVCKALAVRGYLYFQQNTWVFEERFEVPWLWFNMIKYLLNLHVDEKLKIHFQKELTVWYAVLYFTFGALWLAGMFCYIIGSVAIFMKLCKSMVYMEGYIGRLYKTWQPGELCIICYTGKRTQYFQPCGHLACCTECAGQMLECPICKRFIQEEHTTPVIPKTPDSPPVFVPCKACGAENRAQSQRILVPCGHVVSCEDGCARYLEDCPQCREVVTDDKTVFLP